MESGSNRITGATMASKGCHFIQIFSRIVLSWMFRSFISNLCGLTPSHKYSACADDPVCHCDCFGFNPCRS